MLVKTGVIFKIAFSGVQLCKEISPIKNSYAYLIKECYHSLINIHERMLKHFTMEINTTWANITVR